MKNCPSCAGSRRVTASQQAASSSALAFGMELLLLVCIEFRRAAGAQRMSAVCMLRVWPNSREGAIRLLRVNSVLQSIVKNQTRSESLPRQHLTHSVAEVGAVVAP